MTSIELMAKQLDKSTNNKYISALKKETIKLKKLKFSYGATKNKKSRNFVHNLLLESTLQPSKTIMNWSEKDKTIKA